MLTHIINNYPNLTLAKLLILYQNSFQSYIKYFFFVISIIIDYQTKLIIVKQKLQVLCSNILTIWL